MFEIKNFLNKTKEILILSEKSRFKNCGDSIWKSIFQNKNIKVFNSLKFRKEIQKLTVILINFIYQGSFNKKEAT